MEILDKRVFGSNIVKVTRPNKNDCWNIALALALNLDYEVVRKKMKSKMNKDLSVYARLIESELIKGGYEIFENSYKTIKNLAEDTQFTNYEYVVDVRQHVVYVRYGIIYDSFKSDLRHINSVYKRRISSRRTPIHNLVK